MAESFTDFSTWLMVPDSSSEHQRGVVVLSILMILVLLSTFAIYQAEEQNLSIRKVENILQSEQAYQIVMGAEQWAVKLLEKDLLIDIEEGNTEFDHLSEAWANLGPGVKVEGTESEMEIVIIDEQSKLNINNLIQGKPQSNNLNTNVGENNGDETNSESPEASENAENPQSGQATLSWYQLFQKVFLQLDMNPQLTDAIVDWIDKDGDTIGIVGAEDGFYGGLENPYRSANQQIKSLSELHNVRGFNAEAIAKLSDVVTAIPLNSETELTRLNINTANASVLALLSDDPAISSDLLTGLTELRAQRPFESVEDFVNGYLANVPTTLISGIESFLDIKSDFYLSRSCARSGRVELTQSSLLQKNRSQEIITVQLRQSSQGCSEQITPNINSDNPS